jgi:hypothetical protein
VPGVNDDDIPEVIQILGCAYENSLMHADLEAYDLRLEAAAIHFSSRMLDEISQSSCPDDPESLDIVAERTCVPDGELAGLNELSYFTHVRRISPREAGSVRPARGWRKRSGRSHYRAHGIDGTSVSNGLRSLRSPSGFIPEPCLFGLGGRTTSIGP